MEIKTTDNIVFEHGLKPIGVFCNKKWVSVEDIFKDLEETIEKGNVEGGGFSSAIYLSDLKKKLRGVSLK